MEEYWDIFLAEEWNTTPWDVRKHVTYWDIDRLSAMNIAKNKAHRQQAAFDKARQLAADSIRS